MRVGMTERERLPVSAGVDGSLDLFEDLVSPFDCALLQLPFSP